MVVDLVTGGLRPMTEEEVLAWAREKGHRFLQDSIDYVQDNLTKKGSKCPCCGQIAKIRNRKITSSMARGLITLYQHHSTVGWGEWVHLPNLFKEAKVCADNMGALLRFWKLIEECPGERDDGSTRAGFWRITERGRAFVEGRVRVLKYTRMYNRRAYEPLEGDTRTVDIADALGSPFNFQEVMAPVGGSAR